MKRKSIQFYVVIVVLILLFSNFPLARADRGSFVMRQKMQENINVYDAGQKAIICWNDGEEIMILSTDKYASNEAKVLEFMPLPSKPSVVKEMNVSCFESVATIIQAHRPVVMPDYMLRSGKGAGGEAKKSAPEEAVQVVFHEKIGAHDITIGKVISMNGFTDWVKKFLVKHGMQYIDEDVNKIKPVVEDYLKRNYRYFVFDVIELTTQKKTISPILYRFKSEKLFFPLIVTTLSEGNTNIALYLLTPFKTDIWGTDTGFVSGFYAINDVVSYAHPIKFHLSRDEIRMISDELNEFMNGSGKVWFSAAKFRGSTKLLTKDFIMSPNASRLTHSRGKSMAKDN